MLASPGIKKAVHQANYKRPYYQFLDTNQKKEIQGKTYSSMVFIKDFINFYETVLKPNLGAYEQQDLLRAALYSNVQVLNDGQSIRENRIVDGYPINKLEGIFKPFITKDELTTRLIELPKNYEKGLINTNNSIIYYQRNIDNKYSHAPQIDLFEWFVQYSRDQGQKNLHPKRMN